MGEDQEIQQSCGVSEGRWLGEGWGKREIRRVECGCAGEEGLVRGR